MASPGHLGGAESCKAKNDPPKPALPGGCASTSGAAVPSRHPRSQKSWTQRSAQGLQVCGNVIPKGLITPGHAADQEWRLDRNHRGLILIPKFNCSSELGICRTQEKPLHSPVQLRYSKLQHSRRPGLWETCGSRAQPETQNSE